MEITSTAIKGGTMISTGVLADAIIFSDISFLYLAIVGALVSAFGVAHDIFGTNHKQHTIGEMLAELMKGVALGVLAIPFWYIIITSFGGEMLSDHLDVVLDPGTFTSLSLIIAFGLSWFTVPIFDAIAKTIPSIITSLANKVMRFIGKGV